MTSVFVKANVASAQLGVSIRILRIWDEKNLIRTVRTPGGTRLFDVAGYLAEQAQKTANAKQTAMLSGPAVNSEAIGNAVGGGEAVVDANIPIDTWKSDIVAVFKAVQEKVAKGDSKYPICFEKASEWVGFSSKSNGKRHLVANFEENSDYMIYSSKMGLTDFQVPDKNAVTKSGPVPERIYLTAECFKALCMTSATQQGKRVRKFYIDLEQRLQAGDLTLAADVIKRYDEINGTTTNVLLRTAANGASSLPEWVPEWRDARTMQMNRGKTLREVLTEMNITDVNIYAIIEVRLLFLDCLCATYG